MPFVHPRVVERRKRQRYAKDAFAFAILFGDDGGKVWRHDLGPGGAKELFGTYETFGEFMAKDGWGVPTQYQHVLLTTNAGELVACYRRIEGGAHNIVQDFHYLIAKA
jgi:hypothetical protein